MMKLFLLVILLSSSFITFGQNEVKPYTHQDSVQELIRDNFIPPSEIKPQYFIPLSAISRSTLSLRPGLDHFSPSLERINGFNTDLLYPQMSLNDKSKLTLLYMLLGAAQTGAVAWMAYEHIKKFGLLK